MFDAAGLKVTRAVPEKHIINFFGLMKKNFKFLFFKLIIYNFLSFDS